MRCQMAERTRKSVGESTHLAEEQARPGDCCPDAAAPPVTRHIAAIDSINCCMRAKGLVSTDGWDANLGLMGDGHPSNIGLIGAAVADA